MRGNKTHGKEKIMKIYYTTSCDHEEFYFFESMWDLDENNSFMASEAAEDFWDNHDGYEVSWPLTIMLHKNEGGPEIGKYSIMRETVPEFHAIKIEKSRVEERES